MAKTDEIDVVYNDTCPICSREVAIYQRVTGPDVAYHGIDSARARDLGLTPEDAAREFHVMQAGQLVSGIPAFALLWERMPRMRWLAWLVRLPVVRTLAQGIYAWVLAPALYAAHRRRQG